VTAAFCTAEPSDDAGSPVIHSRCVFADIHMAIKELLVQLDQSDEAVVRLRLAMDLALRHASRLTALFVDELNIAELDQRPTPELSEGAHTASGRLRDELETFHRERGLEFEWHYVREFAGPAVKQAALYADLCILCDQGSSNCASADRAFCSDVAVTVGTPLLFIPKSSRLPSVGRRIVVAWDSSRAAARALADALPLIERSEQTTILNVDMGMHGQSVAGLQRLTERLSRHGTRAEYFQIEMMPGKSIGDLLQARASDLGADLMVAGAFGHARVAEKLFGGVTRDLLERMQIPLLLSH
jgi:nucleotide-binding universal stress UspA family protein